MIREILDAYAKATDRVFADGRVNTVGASEVGGCARRTFYAKNSGDQVYGVETDDDYADAWGAALRGRLFEEHFWVRALRARFGDKLLYAGAEQRTFVSGFQSGTPDGLVVDPPPDLLAPLDVPAIADSIVVECKTIDPRARLDRPRPQHEMQAIVQIGLIRELTPHRPEYAVISYANASFPNEIAEFVVRSDPVTYATAKARAARIMTATDAAELAPEGWIAGGKECSFCPFTTACGVLRHAVPSAPIATPPDPQFIAESAELARAIKQHEAEAATATMRLRTAQHELKERLRAKGLRRVVGDGVSITWSAVKGRQSFDHAGIREAAANAGVDLTQYETTGEPTDRLVIRVTEPVRSAA